jgi:hypothetical protein
MGKEDDVRLIAYSIWEQENCPDGKECDHWFKAETIWEEQNKKAKVNSNLKASEPEKKVSQKESGKSKTKKTKPGIKK